MPISTAATSDLSLVRKLPTSGARSVPYEKVRKTRRVHHSSGEQPAGFTLLELSLVLLIMAIVLSFAIPRFRDSSTLELSTHVRRLATTFRFLRNEAVLNGRVYRLNYDLNKQSYWITVEAGATPGEGGALGNTETSGSSGSAGSGTLPGSGDLQDLGYLARPVVFPETVAFSDIVFESTGKLNEGQVFTRFFPDGYVDATVVHMDNGREAYTVTVWPLSGQVSIYEGYRDLEFTS